MFNVFIALPKLFIPKTICNYIFYIIINHIHYSLSGVVLNPMEERANFLPNFFQQTKRSINFRVTRRTLAH